MNPRFFFVFPIAVIVIAGSFTLLAWFFNFSGVFFIENLFSFANPLGVLVVVMMLVLGGFYLFKIGFEILKSSL